MMLELWAWNCAESDLSYPSSKYRMKPVAPISIPSAESRPSSSTKPVAPREIPTVVPQDSVVSSVVPAIQSSEQADAALKRIQAALSPLGARAIDAFNPTDVAKIEKLLSDE